MNLLLAIDLVSVYFELLKVVQNDLTSYFLPTVAQTKEYCAFQVNCQARVQVPNPLSQQAPNPDPKVRPSLKNPILWTWLTQ